MKKTNGTFETFEFNKFYNLIYYQFAGFELFDQRVLQVYKSNKLKSIAIILSI